MEVYRQNWDGGAARPWPARSSDPAGADWSLGVYHTYSDGSGDATNGLNSPNIFAHPSIAPTMEQQADGTLDDRVHAQAVKEVERAHRCRTSPRQEAFTTLPTGDSPVPIIRNEELILLRAEANIAPRRTWRRRRTTSTSSASPRAGCRAPDLTAEQHPRRAAQAAALLAAVRGRPPVDRPAPLRQAGRLPLDRPPTPATTGSPSPRRRWTRASSGRAALYVTRGRRPGGLPPA